jgi:3' terminal RNA ribose 2'-O-methyltransferase Hen1
VSPRSLEIARDRLRLDELPERQRERIALIQSSLTYRDARFAGFEVACAIEVVEHIEPARLGAFERTVFEYARPDTVIVTTPNAEYNARFENLPAGRFRHRDHRFEWTRREFEDWARGVAGRHGYAVRFAPIGEVDAALGPPTQMGVFAR